MQAYELEFEKHTVICREGDPSSELFFLQSGRLLVCTVSGTQVKVISRISPGEFVGELAFFDGKVRSSNLVTLEKCKLIQIPKQEMTEFLPHWYMKVGSNLTKKIRLLDHIIQDKNLRRSTAEENKPLTIEEQRLVYDLLTN